MTEILQTVSDALWGANPLPGRMVVLVILGLVVKAARDGRRQLSRYRREERELERVSRFLAEWRAEGSDGAEETEEGAEEVAQGEAQEGPQAPPDAAAAEDEDSTPQPGGDSAPGSLVAAKPGPQPGLVDLEQLRAAVDPSSLIGDRLGAIAKMRLYRVKVDLDTLQELAHYRDSAAPGYGFPGFAAGLALMLGILGTFIGLSAMVQQIHLGLPTDTANLTMDSWLDSVEQLGAVLGGMKTAFSTSLVGMAAAVALSSTAFQIGHRRRRVFEALERLTAAELIPATVPAVEDEILLAQVSRQLDDSFSRLDEIYRQNQTALAELTAAQQAFVAIVGEVRDITRGQAARNLDGILSQVAKSSEAVLAVSRQIPGIVSVFETTARGLRDSADGLRWPEPAAASPGGPILGLRPVTWLGILAALAVVVGLVRMLNLG